MIKKVQKYYSIAIDDTTQTICGSIQRVIQERS